MVPLGGGAGSDSQTNSLGTFVMDAVVAGGSNMVVAGNAGGGHPSRDHFR